MNRDQMAALWSGAELSVIKIPITRMPIIILFLMGSDRIFLEQQQPAFSENFKTSAPQKFRSLPLGEENLSPWIHGNQTHLPFWGTVRNINTLCYNVDFCNL